MKKSLSVIIVFTTTALLVQNMFAQEIIDAVRSGDLAKVESLLEAKPQLVQAKDAGGRTPLHWACRGVHFEMLKFLVEKGADVNAKDDDGITPLHSLAAKAHSDGIAFLLAYKAEVNARSGFRDTPLHYAAQSGNTDVVKFMLENGADPTARDNMRNTPLLYAIRGNSIEMAEYLISKGGDVDPVLLDVYHSVTPLKTAISIGNIEMFKMLHRNGSDIRYQTPYGENFLHFAVAYDKIDIAEYLITCGIDINSVKAGGLTPLHLAAVFGRTEIAKFLVKKGASLDIKSKDGGTPLHFAAASRNNDIADFLRQSGAKDIPREFPAYKGKYLGQKAPGTEPEPFVPELFRDIYRAYSTPAFSPDGKEVFWDGCFMSAVGSNNRIWWMREENGRWTAPEVAPFSDFASWHSALSPDGRRLYFASDRPRAGKTATDIDLWFSEKLPDGKWSQARHLGSPPNRDSFNDMFPSPAKDGTIYFKVYGPGTRGTHLFKSRFINGKYEAPLSLDDIIDSNSQDDCLDMDHIIFYTFGGPNGAEISITFHKPDGRWTRPVYMGDIVHRRQGTADGKLSSDGKSFFFVQNISPYWVDASFIEALRKEAIKDGRNQSK
jgi:ankyrin repeat protein